MKKEFQLPHPTLMLCVCFLVCIFRYYKNCKWKEKDIKHYKPQLSMQTKDEEMINETPSLQYYTNQNMKFESSFWNHFVSLLTVTKITLGKLAVCNKQVHSIHTSL